MKEIKISFLIAAHNEEKIIGRTLNHLLNIPYENYEIVLGLDGCDDKTEEIVKGMQKKSKKIKYYKLNLRQGKPAVIDEIIKKATGEIIIINDADWLYEIKSSEKIKKFLSVFENENVGGIAESFPAEWHKENLEKSDLGYKMEAYSSYFWLNFQKEKFTYKKYGMICLKEPTMFLTNIFRKKLYKKNFSLGDDFERTKNIMDQKYEIVLFDDLEMPRIKTTYTKTNVKDSFNQKIRTAVARKQLRERDVFDVNVQNYYFPAVWYIFKNSWRKLNVGTIISFWIIMTILATLIAEFKNFGTKEGWQIRIKR